jgi:regulator of protease activity HflC (stomatin/prohibitin superfamily)
MNMNTDFLLMNWNMNSNEPVKVRGFRPRFVVREFECGLLYRYGKFQARLEAGRHVRWGLGYAFTMVDLRKQTFAVAGQEVLSGDNVGLKVSIAVTVQVTDPIKAMHEMQDWRAHVYSLVQIALRALVAAQPVEALLVQRLDLGKQLLAAVQPEAEKIGITVVATEVKDVMFPGDLKKAFAEVLKAKQEGQAALERARGESAALRNLANAARLLESNPALQNLRLIQSISAAGNTLVMGLPTGFVPLKAGKSAPNGQEPRSDELGEA